MRVFSNNRRNALEFWRAFTPGMIQEIVKKPEYSEWLAVACDSMLGVNGTSYLTNLYDEFVSAETSETRKLQIIGSFIGGCIRNKNTKEKHLVYVVDEADLKEAEDFPKGSVLSDTVFRITEETVYGEVIERISFEQDVLELDSMRSYIADECGLDIYTFILHCTERIKGAMSLSKEAIAEFRKIIEDYHLTDMIKSVLSVDGAIEYMEHKVRTCAC